MKKLLGSHYYARFLLTTVVLVTGGSAVGSTTAASPSALESITGSRLMATTRLEGITRVRSSIATSRFRGERLLRVLAFFVFVFFFLFGIQASKSKFMSRTERLWGVVSRTLPRDRVASRADVLNAFRAVCGTRDVTCATTVRTRKIL